jgi:Uma2 family endonuclease
MASRSGAGTKLTYDDYVQIPEDGLTHEIIDGVHVVSPAPNLYHQRVSRRLQFQLFVQVEETGRGEVMDAPCDVVLSPTDIVQPDLLITLNGGQATLDPRFVAGPPELVVEVLSPSSRRRDRGIKAQLYTRAGVPEYWIVDPDRRVVEQHVLEGSAYRLAGTHRETIRPTRIDGVEVDLSRVW